MNYKSILNVKVSPINYKRTLKEVETWIEKRKRSYICVAAVHLVMECQNNKKLLEGVNSSGLVAPDGMPLVWLLSLYGERNIERVYGPTLMLKICELSKERDFKIYLLGGAKGQSKDLKKKLVSRFPKLDIVGYKDTPNLPIIAKEKSNIIDHINRVNPNIVFVGMGCPYQELWMIENRKKLGANVLIGVGAAFDFITGQVEQAPGWLQIAGFEWLFRLIQDPIRLGRRYTITNMEFLYKIFIQISNDALFHSKK